MPSTLAWLDHDAAERERVKRILALFQERGTQDQLGLGGIRDAFADLLFPGTSTIQTRLRYMLFVPWIYLRLEQDEVPLRRITAEARQRELALIAPLLSKQEEGVFGSMAGGGLKRLPSEVYWSGLGAWGIRRFPGSRDQYHQSVDEIYRRRRLARHLRSDDGDAGGSVLTWHAELPAPPLSFPAQATMTVTRQEAEFLRDRIVASQSASLLAFLALHAGPTSVDYPWEHPLLGGMRPAHRRILHHARLFSEVTYGAAILYNIMLAQQAGRTELIEEHRVTFTNWVSSLDHTAIAAWQLGDLWSVTYGQGHTITPQAREFVERWVGFVRADAGAIPRIEEARRLVHNREMLLKGPRSFFRNQRALEERWGGYSGLRGLSYRWPNVQALLNDLFAGLGGN